MRPFVRKVRVRVRPSSAGLDPAFRLGRFISVCLGSVSWLAHLFVMDKQRIAGLGLEPVLTTSELAEYLGVRPLSSGRWPLRRVS